MDINIESEKVPLIQLELLIQIAACQRAQAKLLIELSCVTPEDINSSFLFYETEVQTEIERVLREIHVRHSDLDLSDLFKK